MHFNNQHRILVSITHRRKTPALMRNRSRRKTRYSLEPSLHFVAWIWTQACIESMSSLQAPWDAILVAAIRRYRTFFVCLDNPAKATRIFARAPTSLSCSSPSGTRSSMLLLMRSRSADPYSLSPTADAFTKFRACTRNRYRVCFTNLAAWWSREEAAHLICQTRNMAASLRVINFESAVLERR